VECHAHVSQQPHDFGTAKLSRSGQALCNGLGGHNVYKTIFPFSQKNLAK